MWGHRADLGRDYTEINHDFCLAPPPHCKVQNYLAVVNFVDCGLYLTVNLTLSTLPSLSHPLYLTLCRTL